jgi:zinc transport system substrate-binding protein
VTHGFTVIATLFPQYDFARQIAGDRADVKLLLPPGVESHAFEPTPSDVIAINEADVFIYTGEYMEPWAHKIAESIEGDVLVADVSLGIARCRRA